MSEESYNGIQQPEKWPPQDINLKSGEPIHVPYLESPPEIIPIDTGRQLLVDDFLIEKTTMTRVFHQPVKHTGNPVFSPQTQEERHPDFAPCAAARSGVWYDDNDKLFKMWYMAGYAGALAYAESRDGLHWERPELDVVPGTNLCLPRSIRPDSGTVWLDKKTKNSDERFKVLLREPNCARDAKGVKRGGNGPGLLMTSKDGIHWSEPVLTGPMGDRSTMFYNPFRGKWVQSIRSGGGAGRTRHYWENEDFLESGRWEAGDPIPWARADYMDEADYSLPQLYTLDAVAYESVMLGLFQIFKGPPNKIGGLTASPKLTELTVGYSRDGFHWHRPDRRAFIGAHRVFGSWEYGYVEPVGGVCLVMGDELWFYYCAFGGDETRREHSGLENGMYGNGAVGLAKLRRDGFASMQARFPDTMLSTRPLTFSGNRMFLNANTAGGELRVEVADKDGEIIPGFSTRDCIPFVGNSTCAEIRWEGKKDLSELAGRPLRFRLTLNRGEIFSFWVSNSPEGASGGYINVAGD